MVQSKCSKLTCGITGTCIGGAAGGYCASLKIEKKYTIQYLYPLLCKMRNMYLLKGQCLHFK